MGQSEPIDRLKLQDLAGDRLVAWLLEGAQRAAQPAPQPIDAELDFLLELEEAPPQLPPLTGALASAPRMAELAELIASGAAQRLAALGPAWLADPRLAAVDAPGAELALRAALALPAGIDGDRGPLSQLVARALQSGNAALSTAAVQLTLRLCLGDLQESIAECLQRNSPDLTPTQRSLFLDALEALGDGRCVRAMEAFLAARAGLLLDHEAWRARHIVQRIRRGGRR